MERQPHTNPDRATSRVAMYEDQALCTKLLDSVTAAVPLQILPSKIAGAGAGLFTTKDIDCGEEIFWSCPVVNCVVEGKNKLVCDNCYIFKDSIMHTSGRFREEEDSKLQLKACSGCKVSYYCSKVITSSTRSALILRCAPNVKCAPY